MSSLKATVHFIATMMLLSIGLVLYPQGSANAARFCVTHIKGAAVSGPCFSSHHRCAVHVAHRGGGRCELAADLRPGWSS
jgi:hypothetical protein